MLTAPQLDLPLVHKNVYHFFFCALHSIVLECMSQKIMCSMLSVHLTCNARINTLRKQDYPTWVFSAKTQAAKEHPFILRPFAHFRARFAELRARFAPLFQDKKMLSSTSCPKS